MQEPEEDGVQGPLGRLLGSLGDFLATLLTIGRTRIELLTVELQLEAQRVAELMVWAIVAICGTGFAVLMGGIAIIVAFWDTHRLLATVAVTGAYVIVAAVAGLVLARKIRSRPRLLNDTLNELARDSEQLRRSR